MNQIQIDETELLDDVNGMSFTSSSFASSRKSPYASSSSACSRIGPYTYLFDLDGTLVNTESTYFSVWQTLFDLYATTSLTYETFINHIYGHNDEYVYNQFFGPVQELAELPNAAINHIPTSSISSKTLSIKKDELFLKEIHSTTLIEGTFEYMKALYLRRDNIGVVTNCNRETAIALLKHHHLLFFTSIIIANGDCKRPKPHPDPYIKAMNILGVKPINCIIFEDSKTGLLSANSVTPYCVVGLETHYNKETLLEAGADVTIQNFKCITPELFVNVKAFQPTLIKFVENSIMNTSYTEIAISNEKLKGGFIAEVYKVSLDNDHYVLKLENKRHSNLSEMSKLLCLYENEYYFYHDIANYTPVKTPRFLSIVKDDNLSNIGILLENLYMKLPEGSFNVKLDTLDIKYTYKIIDELVKMHTTFWNKDTSMFPYLKRHSESMIISNFIQEHSSEFHNRWVNEFSDHSWSIIEQSIHNIHHIQKYLSTGSLTFCHGDVKSANIFYNLNTETPYFCDWQYISKGKGTQDLVFFIIESFPPSFIKQHKKQLLEYYFKNISDVSGNYTWSEFVQDVEHSLFYFPLFVMIWFGTVDTDELIDKSFPYNFIQRFKAFLE